MSMYNAIDQLFESEALKEADRESRFRTLEDAINRKRAKKLQEDFRARDYGDDIIAAIEDGFLTWEEVATAAVKYMDTDMLKDMAKLNDWSIADDEDFEDSSSDDTSDSDDLDEEI